MKSHLFFSVLAALPSVISAFSTHSGLYVRNAGGDYGTTLSIRDAVAFPDAYEESYDIVMRSLEARFAEKAHEIAHSIAKRAVEDDAFDGESILVAREPPYKVKERDYATASHHYNGINRDAASSPSEKAQAAKAVQSLAQQVVNLRQVAFNRYNDGDPGHLTAIQNWQNCVNNWAATVARHELAATKLAAAAAKPVVAAAPKSAPSGKKTRSLDDFNFLNILYAS